MTVQNSIPPNLRDKIQNYHFDKLKILSLSKDSLKFKVFVFFLLTFNFALLTFNLSEARAQLPSRTFTISPPSIKLTLKPGAQAERYIKITNRSEEPLEFVAGTVDFIVNDKAGTPELLPADVKVDNRFSAASWSTVLPNKIVVAPGKTTTTALYLQVPGDARPGGRYFAVTLRPKSEGLLEESGAAINSVVGSLVYLTVAGPTEENTRVVALSAPALSEYGPIELSTEIKNQGDVHSNPKATIEIKDLFGRKVFSTALADHNIFPGTSRLYKNTWETKWLLGRYSASLSGYYGQENSLPLLAMTSFWVIPYKLIIAIVLAILIGLVAYFFARRSSQPEEVEEEEKK